MSISFFSNKPELVDLWIRKPKKGTTKVEQVAHRGIVSVGRTSAGRLYILSPWPKGGCYMLPHHRGELRSVLECCVDLGALSREAFEQHMRDSEEWYKRTRLPERAKYAIQTIESIAAEAGMTIKPPKSLMMLASGGAS